MIVCDHASNFLPSEFGTLGISETAHTAHIAWDPGALGVSRRLARRLDAPLVHCAVSRLVIDCNRALDAPDLIVAVSDRVAIPGNAALSEDDVRRRVETVHVPYHAAIDQLVNERLAAGRETALVAVHSFTPVYGGVSRPWEIGVLFDRDRSIADRLIADFKAEGLVVGVNEPYSPDDRVYYTLTRHAEERGLAAVMLEIRNDLIGDEGGEEEWGARLARLFSALPVSSRAA